MVKILITGGNGCLGQHIIKHFQDKAESIEEIRVLDLDEFEQKLDYKCKIPIVSVIGSVTDTEILNETTRGVQSVIHAAGCIDVRLFPDEEKLDTVNRKGTELLLEASYRNNVEIFIYCSTIDVMQGYKDVINGTEEDTKPHDLLFGGYARTKLAGENASLNMNKAKLPNGSIMRTVSLRPLVMYGELDQHFVPVAIDAGFKNNKIMIDFSGKGHSSVAYVGNVAWAFVCAYTSMTLDKWAERRF